MTEKSKKVKTQAEINKEHDIEYCQLFLDMVAYKRPSNQIDDPIYQEFLGKFIEPVFGKPAGESHNYIHVVYDKEGNMPDTCYTAHHDTVHKTTGMQTDFLSINDGCLTRANNKNLIGDIVVELSGDKKETETFSEKRFVYDKVKRKFLNKKVNVEKVKTLPKPNCLGADCTTGIFIILKMIDAKVPGIYVIFEDEEIGRIGSKATYDEILDAEITFSEKGKCIWETDFNDKPQMKELKELAPMSWWIPFTEKMISFDRHGTDSIITKQSGSICASDKFVEELKDVINPSLRGFGYDGLDADMGGSFTDSYSFIHIISECTNLSVGYKSQHSSAEIQNLSYLTAITLCLTLKGHEINSNVGSHRDFTTNNVNTKHTVMVNNHYKPKTNYPKNSKKDETGVSVIRKDDNFYDKFFNEQESIAEFKFLNDHFIKHGSPHMYDYRDIDEIENDIMYNSISYSKDEPEGLKTKAKETISSKYKTLKSSIQNFFFKIALEQDSEIKKLDEDAKLYDMSGVRFYETEEGIFNKHMKKITKKYPSLIAKYLVNEGYSIEDIEDGVLTMLNRSLSKENKSNLASKNKKAK